MFYILFELSFGIRAGALIVVSLPMCDPIPLLRWIDLNHLMLLQTSMRETMHFGKFILGQFYVPLKKVFGML